MPKEKQSRVWQRLPSSRHASHHVEVSRKTANILRHHIFLSRRRRLMLSSHMQHRHHPTNSGDEKSLSLHLVGTIDEIHGQRKVRRVLEPSHRWEKPHAIFVKKTLSVKSREPFVHTGNPGASGAPNCVEFLVATDPRAWPCEKALSRRAREGRSSHQPGGCKRNGRQAVYFSLVNPLDTHAD